MRRAPAALLRLLLGAVFLWAAAVKLPDMAGFAESVANYRVLPPGWVPLFAAALVGVELVAGAALVAGWWPRAAAAVVALLLLVFTAALSQALLRGIDLACGCFGGKESASWGTVGRDLALLALAIASLALGPGRLTAPRAGAAP